MWLHRDFFKKFSNSWDKNLKSFKKLQITRQKADIRCELLEARRKLEQFDEKREELEKQRDDALDEVRRLQKEKIQIEKELEELKVSEAKRFEEIDKLKADLAGFELVKREYETTKTEIQKAQEKLSQMGKHLIMADNQCQHFKDLKVRILGFFENNQSLFENQELIGCWNKFFNFQDLQKSKIKFMDFFFTLN